MITKYSPRLVLGAVALSLFAGLGAACGREAQVVEEVQIEAQAVIGSPVGVEVETEMVRDLEVERPVVVSHGVVGEVIAEMVAESDVVRPEWQEFAEAEKGVSKQAIGVLLSNSEVDLASPGVSKVKPQVADQRMRYGGNASFVRSLEGLLDIEPDSEMAKIITIDIKRDENYNYYFEPDGPLTVPAGQKVKFVIRNIHIDSDDCW